jgi:hypothetical protein
MTVAPGSWPADTRQHLPPRRPGARAGRVWRALVVLGLVGALLAGAPSRESRAARLHLPVAHMAEGLLAADLEGAMLPAAGRRPADRPEPDRDSTIDAGGGQEGGLSGKWQALARTPLMRRAISAASWVVAGLRLLWSLPKALVKGDSRSLIEAIGELLSRASPSPEAEAAPDERGQSRSLDGGENTRPGAARDSSSREASRVLGPSPADHRRSEAAFC